MTIVTFSFCELHGTLCGRSRMQTVQLVSCTKKDYRIWFWYSRWQRNMVMVRSATPVNPMNRSTDIEFFDRGKLANMSSSRLTLHDDNPIPHSRHRCPNQDCFSRQPPKAVKSLTLSFVFLSLRMLRVLILYVWAVLAVNVVVLQIR